MRWATQSITILNSVREVYNLDELLTTAKAISSIGFPAVMCLILLYRMDKQATLYSESEAKLRECITNNTIMIKELCIRLGGQKNE